MTDRELMQMALEALGLFASDESDDGQMAIAAYVALRERLAQPEPEPVAWLIQYSDRHEFVWGKKPVFLGATVLAVESLYTAPPKREWVGLTDGDIAKTMHGSVEGSNMLPYQFARAIEDKLKEKNG